jgi:hypothetical protein
VSYVKFLGIKVPCALGDLIMRVLDYIVTISFGYILNCGFCTLYCGCFNLLCNVWVCVSVGFVMCACLGNMYTCIYCVLYCLYCVFLYCSSMYIFLFATIVRDYCHRVTTQLQLVIIISQKIRE